MEEINRHVVVLCDSRGKGLQDLLKRNQNIDYFVKKWGGHDIMAVTVKGLKIIEAKRPVAQ